LAIAISTAPANAEWKSYIVKELGFSVMAPGEVKAEIGTYRGEVAGPRQTIVFKSTEDNIEYKVTVISFRPSPGGRRYPSRRTGIHVRGDNVLTDAFNQVEVGKDTFTAARSSSISHELRADDGAFYSPTASSIRSNDGASRQWHYASPIRDGSSLDQVRALRHGNRARRAACPKAE